MVIYTLNTYYSYSSMMDDLSIERNLFQDDSDDNFVLPTSEEDSEEEFSIFSR